MVITFRCCSPETYLGFNFIVPRFKEFRVDFQLKPPKTKSAHTLSSLPHCVQTRALSQGYSFRLFAVRRKMIGLFSQLYPFRVNTFSECQDKMGYNFCSNVVMPNWCKNQSVKKVGISEWCLKDHVLLKTRVMMLKNLFFQHRNYISTYI